MATQLQRWTAVVCMAAAGMLVGACGGGDDDEGGSAGTTSSTGASGSEAPAGGAIEVSGKEFSFTPDTLTLTAGQAQKIVLMNTGSIEHDITVSEADFKLAVLAGKSGEKTLTIDKPGTYKMFCSVAGHEAAGMKGEITVS
jgi:cytochrome c oxidase subunit II